MPESSSSSAVSSCPPHSSSASLAASALKPIPTSCFTPSSSGAPLTAFKLGLVACLAPPTPPQHAGGSEPREVIQSCETRFLTFVSSSLAPPAPEARSIGPMFSQRLDSCRHSGSCGCTLSVTSRLHYVGCILSVAFCQRLRSHSVIGTQVMNFEEFKEKREGFKEEKRGNSKRREQRGTNGNRPQQLLSRMP